MAANNCSRPVVEVVTDVPIESAPIERNKCPSGSTNHHLPSIFSTRKKPVALAFEPSYPPYLQKPKSPLPSALSSAAHAACSCSRLVALPGQSSPIHCPN